MVSLHNAWKHLVIQSRGFLSEASRHVVIIAHRVVRSVSEAQQL